MMQPLYVKRNLLNQDDVLGWARRVGLYSVLRPEDLHVTVAIGAVHVDWSQIPPTCGPITVAGGYRSLENLGHKGAIVLRFECPEIQERADYFRETISVVNRAFHMHLTVGYDPRRKSHLIRFARESQPYTGPLMFSEEVFEPTDHAYRDKLIGRQIVLREKPYAPEALSA